MKLRIATYNVNNLFSRPRVLELPGMSRTGKTVLDDVAELAELLERASYEGRPGKRIVRLLERYGIGRIAPEDAWFQVQQVRGKLFSVGKRGKLHLTAKGRAAWVGWIELTRTRVAGAAVENTARVLGAIDADIACLVEVEGRATLDRFNRDLLNGAHYPHVMAIEGNDARGIDVGLLSRFEIRTARSHVDDTYRAGNGAEQRVFSRDCAEYELTLPDGESLWMLCNHFKSKGYGRAGDNDDKRRQQARRVRDLVSRFDLARDRVVVAGDLNDTPDSDPLRDLVETPRLHDVLDRLPPGEPRWTYRDGRGQIDYLLVSEPLWERIENVGIERRGIWSRNGFGGAFPCFAEVTDLRTQASDHAAVWVDVRRQ